MKKRKTFQELADLVKAHGGSMQFEREGYEGGAWVIRLGGKYKVFPSTGSGNEGLDQMYRLKRDARNPSRSDAYSRELVDDAWERLERLMGLPT